MARGRLACPVTPMTDARTMADAKVSRRCMLDLRGGPHLIESCTYANARCRFRGPAPVGISPGAVARHDSGARVRLWLYRWSRLQARHLRSVDRILQEAGGLQPPHQADRGRQDV